MIVYGDHARRSDPRAELAMLDRRLRALAPLPAGSSRHAKLAAVLIALGEVTQGIADVAFAAFGVDRSTPTTDALGRALLALAQALIASWDSGFTIVPPLPGLPADLDLPDEVEMRLAEGFAYYALYPEAVAAAARTLQLGAPARIIGIRSIGTTLGAIAAAALGAPPPFTVRPAGHPFARTIAIAEADTAALLAGEAHYVIVDEGPGLSGSSFAAVHRWLAEHGVPRDRVAFLPSHGGEPGGQASPEVRGWWDGVQRAPVDRHPLLGTPTMERWVETVAGQIDAPLVDLAGGGWRAQRWRDPDDWPAVYPARERPKWLALAGGRSWLVKFVGLGGAGHRAATAARTLGEAGLSPRVAGETYGLLVEDWVDGTAPEPINPRHLTAAARYLATRASLLPAPSSPGASLDTLKNMAAYNVGQALGAAAGEQIRARLEGESGAATRPVWIDGRMDLTEWRVRPGGGLLKCDAVDHVRAHDLIGAQDIAWDVAGLLVEWAPDAAGRALVLATLAETGVSVDRSLLLTFELCYAAFRLGEAEMARAATSDDREAARLVARSAHLRDQLFRKADLE